MTLYVLYILLAFTVIMLSVKAARYVDLIDKKTKISGAFIGGVLLSSVTSLPELLTSLSAIVWLDNPDLCLGNILGSNFFNVTVLAVLILSYRTFYQKSIISVSHSKVLFFTICIGLAVTINMYAHLPDFISLSPVSILVLLFYLLGVRTMANDTTAAPASKVETTTSDLTLKTICIRFILVSAGLVTASIAITYVTDQIATNLHIGASFAGALFLGIATSLPEVTSCISLVKMKNFNVAVGNITGSNLFNYFVLFLADLVYFKGSVYIYDSQQTKNLLLLGLTASLLIWLVLKYKNSPWIMFTGCFGVITCYVGFLLL